MIDADRPRFAVDFLGLTLVFEKEITPEVAEIYFQILSRFTVSEVSAGILRACATLKFFPRPAELVECIMESMTVDRRGEVEALRIYGRTEEAIQ